MNDLGEGNSFFENFFTTSKNSEELKELKERIINEDGEIFEIAFSRSKEKRTHNGKIPMWKMYGDGGNGGILKFNYRKLKSFCDSKGFLLNECIYFNDKEMTECARIERDKIKQLKDKHQQHFEMKRILLKAFYYKDICWKDEDEYRITAQSSNYCRDVPKPYFEIKIPISCLTGIIIGPSLKKMDQKREIEDIVKKINQIINNKEKEIKVYYSNLKINLK